MSETVQPTLLAGCEYTDDIFLGGRLTVRQPKRGYRAGIDPVLLAATIDPGFAGRALDVGAGAGVIGLCVAARCSSAEVAMIERDELLVAFSRASIAANGLDARVSALAGDVLKPSELPFAAESFDLVLANPPYHDDAAGTLSDTPIKAAANAMAAEHLEAWARFLTRMAKPGGKALLIHKAEALPRLLEALGRRFGALRILPIHPRRDAPANRIIVSGVKGSRAPMTLLPGFVLHEADGRFTPHAKAISRDGAALDGL